MARRTNNDSLKSLQKLKQRVVLSKSTIQEKKKQLRDRTKKLKNCTAIINVLCNHVLPHSESSVDVKNSHLTLKEAEKLGMKEVVKRHNQFMALSSMQCEAFNYVFDAESFLFQAIAKNEEQDAQLQKKLTQIDKEIEKALASVKSKPRSKPKPVKTVQDAGDCSDTDADQYQFSIY